MEFEQTEKQITGFEISEFEKTNEINLPKDFVQFYLSYNGGYPPYEYVKGVKNIFTINGFNSIKYGSLPIEQIIADYKKSGIIFEKKFHLHLTLGGAFF